MGIRNWNGDRGASTELKRALQQSSSSYPLYVSTMVDYYALPLDWPERRVASEHPAPMRAELVESGMRESVRELLGDDRRIEYFIPYVSLHELEALLLSKPDALLAEFPGSKHALAQLQADIVSMEPERINDGKDSAPSKRIQRFFCGYAADKSATVVRTLKFIGLEHLRATCPHFGQWLRRLESLAQV